MVCVVLSVASFLLAGCTAVVTSTAQLRVFPFIQSFAASPSVIAAGSSTSLTAVFSSGSGILMPGNLAVSSGVALSVAPTTTTSYALTVTSSSGAATSSTIAVTVVPAPAIASFSASPASIAAGSSSSLTAVFANGTGIVTPGNLAVSSGVAFSVTPAATTVYTLLVTSRTGATAAASVTVTVIPTAPAAANLGINIGLVNDWDREQIFADAMRQARRFGSVAAPYDETSAVDADGWPTQDAGVLIIAGNQGAWSAGTYALSFTGQATVNSWDDGSVTVGPVSYSAATNTSTATVTVGPSYQSLYLVFTNTRRTAASATGTGITKVALLRPTVNGTPHAAGTLFTDRLLSRLKYFSALRVKDFTATDSSTESDWAARPLPTNASQQQVPAHASQNRDTRSITGTSYEYAIQLANQTGKDLYLNIPHLALGGSYQFTSTTWATNLALLLKYGSDANGNPYTGLNGSAGANPQPAVGPVNPPLKAGLHVYVEYSNELWSGTGTQTAWVEQQAAAAIAAHDADLDWDSTANVFTVEMRIGAKGTLLIAEAFASVYGSSAFGSVYRPVLGAQVGNWGTFSGLDYLEKRHGGAAQYVWAAAGAPYIDFAGDTTGNTLTEAQVIVGMQANEAANLQSLASGMKQIATTYGLAGGTLAYEGGQGAVYQTAGAVVAQTNPAMRTVVTTLLDDWKSAGNGIFFYYKLCSQDMWGLATDISYDIDADSGWTVLPATSAEAQPKWGAIKQIAVAGQ
jgi:hypothetical protein